MAGLVQDVLRACVEAARRVAAQAARCGAALDADDSFPAREIEALARHGLLRAPLLARLGGADLAEPHCANALALVLSALGAGSLPLGRLYEGHVNALALILRYGTPAQARAAALRAQEGELLAVWNTEGAQGVRLEPQREGFRLEGAKILASGAGFVRYPLITAREPSGALLMVAPDAAAAKADLAGWRAHGMRASASGAVDFSGLPVSAEQIVGGPDDYHRQPPFSAGAWRFAAVHYGGIAALFDLARAHLVKTARADDPHQAARLGQAAIAVETARLWTFEAAQAAHLEDAEVAVAYVNLARLAVERAGLDVLELVHRSVGLSAFMRPHPIERLSRDLATYLRQPAPDRALTEAARFLARSERPIGEQWERP